MAFTILYPDAKHRSLDVEIEAVGQDVTLVNARKNRFEEIEPGVWQSCDAIVVSRLPIDASVIAHLKRCRIIVRNGVGFDVLDLKGLGEAGIPACNIPDYGTTEVADSAIAMMLAFARGTAAMDAALRTDLSANWTHERNVTARRLRGATFGVIGLGRIGTAAALRARAFGMNVVFYDPLLPGGAELGLGFTRARTLHALLGQADVIDIHTPLNEQTRNMIDAVALAAIKPGAYLINTARGPICDTAALLEGLRSGRLLAVGLDVLPKEPGQAADPLVAAWQANEPWIRGRVLLNPHSAFFSPDAYIDQRTKAVQTAYHYLRDGSLVNCVNSEFLARRR
ncbi:MAG: C-terminal binding protein [Burkholderiales bacterium]|nr:C-terminal binding protein [Burkholderiales bacterium]